MSDTTKLQFVSKIITKIGELVSYSIFLLLILVVAEVASRYLFGNPTIWSSELQTYIYAIYFILGGAYTLYADGHVRIETFYDKMKGRKRFIVDIMNFLCIAIVSVLLMWKGTEAGIESLLAGERSHTVWAPYIAPIKLAVPIGGGMLLIAACIELIKSRSNYLEKINSDSK